VPASVVGAFSEDGRTTPAATRMEGLLAALRFLPPGEATLRAQALDAVRYAMRFLLATLVRSGPHAGAIPRAVAPLPEEHSDFSRKFNRRATEVRIDYVQHALSAMLAYEDLLRGESAAGNR